MKRPDLRLVPKMTSAGDPVPKAITRVGQELFPHNYQFSLPFESKENHKNIVVISVDRAHGSDFCRLILKLKPKVAIDVRHLIRFDLPGTNRSEVFQCFKLSHTIYINESIPFHEFKPRDFLVSDNKLSQRLHHEIVERGDSPILILVSKAEEARYLTSYLHRLLSSHAAHPWKVEQAN